MFALLDGNNFYASCERAFNPKLRGRPVVVLSNNDGCVISRSEEAKAIGIKMGQPAFECKYLFKRYNVAIFSANFQLYGDMSHRMMGLASLLGYEQEIYSIDECFLTVDGIANITQRAKDIRQTILQGIGIPTCIGIAPTKTLAKLSNHIAKSAERKPGSYPIQFAQVFNWSDVSDTEQKELLKATPISEIWGVGRRTAKPLIEADIETAYDLINVDLGTVRKRFSVTMERTVCELRGVPCIELDTSTARKQVTCTRSFSSPVTELKDLKEAVSEFTSKAAFRLRKQRSLAGQVYVFIHTSPHRKGRQAARSITVPLQPTNVTQSIVKNAIKGLEAIYSKGFDWIKAGVILLDLQPEDIMQGGLNFDEPQSNDKLTQTLDALNNRFGSGSIALASTGITQRDQGWRMRQKRLSRHYTTDLDQIPKAS